MTDSLTVSSTIAQMCSSLVKLPVILIHQTSADFDGSLAAGSGCYQATQSGSLEARGVRSVVVVVVVVVGKCMERMESME